MEIGVGLPSTIPSATGDDVLGWAVEADEAGYSSLGTVDRVVYGNHETVPTLAAAAAVTRRARLLTAVLVAPFRGNGALLAKQLATVDSFAGGRLVVGIAVGVRTDDYTATGTDFDGRGAAFDAQLTEMRQVWSGAGRGTAGPIGPPAAQPGGPPLLIGGYGRAAMRRVGELGHGWVGGSGGPDAFAAGAARAREAWTAAGREGEPRLVAIAFYALGPDAANLAERYLGDYYSFAPDRAPQVVAGALTDPAALRSAITRYADAGCHELVLLPCAEDRDQLRRLTEITLSTD